MTAKAVSSKWAKRGVLSSTGVVSLLFAFGGWLLGLVSAVALLGMPLFAVMGGTAELAWLTHSDPALRHLRFLAPPILDTHFSDSPILVTIPLFTLVGYVLAEAKTPDRLVRGARALFGWMPGGLAIVCVLASAIFTLLTGGSGVTIIAIGGLLYPALRKENYSERFSLGLVTAGGSVGLLLPLSLPLMIFSLVAHVDILMTFKAVIAPGLLVIVMLCGYAALVGYRENIPRDTPRLGEIRDALWDLKWELLIPALLLLGLGSGLTSIDEIAGIVALYTLFVEFVLYKDLSFRKDLVRICKDAMSMAGAIFMILAMANAFMHYVVDAKIPTAVLDALVSMGVEHRFQFLLVMNLFLLVLGMLMEGFSAILIAVPLVLPFVSSLAARHPDEAISPFQLAMIFILNLELAYCMPPLGLNLFIGSFRFGKPVAVLYRAVVPFLLILMAALLLVSYVPKISTVLVEKDIALLRKKADEEHAPPKAAWMLECVQDDPTDPKPCTREDRERYAETEKAGAKDHATEPAGEEDAPHCNPDFGPCDSPTPCNPDFEPCP